MKKILCMLLMIAVLLAGCSNGESKEKTDSTGGVAEKKEELVRSPMPKYEKMGVDNTVSSTDGRYIYYTYFDTVGSKGKLCRMDMNGENAEQLWEQSYQRFSDIYINDGSLYLSYGRIAYSIDIATPPTYFKGKDGYVANIPIVDSASASEFMEISNTQADDEYIYFASSGLYRVKKDASGLERILYGEELVNFYDLKLQNDFLFAYCGDDQKLYRMNTDGSNLTEICKPMESHVIYDGYVYYIVSGTNAAQQLTRTSLDAGETQTITSLGEGWVDATLYNAMDNKLYYSYKDENNVYEIRTYDILTSEVKTLCQTDGRIDALDVIDDYVFFRCLDGEKLMRMNTRTAEITELK